MAKKVQRRSLNAATMAATIALPREIVIEDTNWIPYLHDGITPGGIPIARGDLANVADATNGNDGKMTKEQVAQQESNTARGFGVLDKAITGNTSITADEAENFGFNFTGVLAADAEITFPDEARFLLVENNTTGGFNLIIKTSTGVGTITVTNGDQDFLKVDDAFNVTKLADTAKSVQKAGDTMTGDLVIDKATPVIRLKTDGLTDAVVELHDGTVLRGRIIWDESNESVTLVSNNDVGAVVNVVDITNTADVIHVNGNVIWHAGNDGPGSGLNADLLDSKNLDAAATGDTVALRGAGGVLLVGTPTAATHAATKAFVEGNAASKAEMEAGVVATKFASPANFQDHPGAAKAWVNFNGGNGAIRSSYNVTGVTRNSLGNYTITFDVDFADTDYIANVTSLHGPNGCIPLNPTYAVGTFRFDVERRDNGSAIDATYVNASFFGTQ